MGWNEEIKSQLGSCGRNVFIGHNVIFTNPKNVHLGDNVRIDPFTLITTGLKTGSNVQICSHAVLGGGSQHTVTMGDWSFIGYGSKLFCGSEDYTGEHGPVNDFWGSNKVYHGDISIGNYSGIASDVILMPGVNLPDGCNIGLKSVVWAKDELKPYSIYFGNPLKFHKNRDKDAILRLASDPSFIKQKFKSLCIL